MKSAIDSKIDSKKEAPIILVGGGSGGHIFPLVAIGEELLEKKQPFIFVGSENGREKEVVERLGWPYSGIKAGKWRRYSSLQSWGQNFVDIFNTLIGFFQSLSILRRTKAKVVFSKGGYVALPMVYAARFTRRRLIIHESDAVMGVTNRLSANFADRVLTAFDPSIFASTSSTMRHVGIPIRKSLRMAAGLKAPKKSRPLLLILPGSQGAHFINELVEKILPSLLTLTDVIHLTGEKDYQHFVAIKNGLLRDKQSHYKPYNFIDRELPYYFQSADLLICRASATIISEAALFGRAAYLIPLPTAAGNHQLLNAKQLEKMNAAIVREERILTAEMLLRDVKDLMQNPEKLESLGAALKNYFREDSTLSDIMAELSVPSSDELHQDQQKVKNEKN